MKYGLRAAALTSNTCIEERKRVNKTLTNELINYLFVVDIFNDGIDIPEIDTVLFLRPTDSLTIFLQQLGRGLRLCAGKDILTVLDFVAQVNWNYDFTTRFRALCVRQNSKIEDQISNGFTLLPQGCSIFMERKARNYILNNIHGSLYNFRKLVKEPMLYDYTPTLSQFINNCGQHIRLIYRNGRCWTTLKCEVGKYAQLEQDDNVTKLLIKGVSNLVNINSISFIRFIRNFIENDCKVVIDKSLSECKKK